MQVAKDVDQPDVVLQLTPMVALADSSWKCLSGSMQKILNGSLETQLIITVLY